MSDSKNYPLVPVSILIAGVLIAGSIILSGGEDKNTDSANTGQNAAEILIAELDSKDHIRGNRNAEVVLVEYSDIQCPFCQRYHTTLNQILAEYDEGEFAWAYRHFPLDQIHPNARPAAIASECIAKIGSEDAFWSFLDRAFEDQSRLGASFYRETALSLGVDGSKYDACLTDSSIAKIVEDDLQDGVEAGGTGTPYSVIIMKNGDIIPLKGGQFGGGGAFSYEALKGYIDELLAS